MLDVFKALKAQVEKQSGKVIKILRTDGGGEFTSNNLESLCEKEMIVHEITPYIPPNTMAQLKEETKLL